jgi:hypothetical protein
MVFFWCGSEKAPDVEGFMLVLKHAGQMSRSDGGQVVVVIQSG